MRTLLFCTSFAICHDVWAGRYARWLHAIRRSNLEFDQILLIDDCSPTLPTWPDLVIIPADGTALPYNTLVMTRFTDHLGRQEVAHHSTSPGWYRSFGYAAQYASAGGFSKLVHIESDAFILSRRLETFTNELVTGWTTLWCPLYKIPEDNIQIIADSSIGDCAEFFSRPYSSYSHDVIEKQYPFTKVARQFIGDRYGEYQLDVPSNAEYVTQARDYPQQPDNYFWWLTDQPCPLRSVPLNLRMLSVSDDVQCAYNLFLFRDAENADVIGNRVGISIRDLICALITSQEFRENILPNILNRTQQPFNGSKPIWLLKDWLLRVLAWDARARAGILHNVEPAPLVLATLRHPDIVPWPSASS